MCIFVISSVYLLRCVEVVQQFIMYNQTHQPVLWPLCSRFRIYRVSPNDLFGFKFNFTPASPLHNLWAGIDWLIDWLIKVAEKLQSVCVTVPLSGRFQSTERRQIKVGVWQQLGRLFQSKHLIWHEHHHLFKSYSARNPIIDCTTCVTHTHTFLNHLAVSHMRRRLKWISLINFSHSVPSCVCARHKHMVLIWAALCQLSHSSFWITKLVLIPHLTKAGLKIIKRVVDFSQPL